MNENPQIHPTAIVEPGAEIGAGAKVWHFCHIRSGARLGPLTSLGRDVFLDAGVDIGEGTRVQNGVSIYRGVEVGRFCFIGPHAVFTNDLRPRVGKGAWQIESTVLENGMSLGAGSIVRCGVRIGAFAMIGAGGVVTKSVEPFTLAMGLPAEPVARICACGETQMPLDAIFSAANLLRDCCRQNLNPEVLALAEGEIRRLAPT